MIDESSNISSKTWTRAVENINKVGYSDGVTDAQTSTFQSSFDIGYKQGLDFGIELGYKNAVNQQLKKNNEGTLPDTRNINCQICLNGAPSTENVVNLYNQQKEKNDEYLKKHK